jgi:hypothetical protein
MSFKHLQLTRHCCQTTVKTDGSIAYDRWKYCLVYNKIGMSYSSMFMHPYIHLSDITISCRCHSSVILPQYFFNLALLHPRQRAGCLLVFKMAGYGNQDGYIITIFTITKILTII